MNSILKMVRSRRAVTAATASLIIVVFVVIGFVGYVGYKEGWFNTVSKTTARYGPVDGRYFNTEQEMQDYFKTKYGGTTGKYPIAGSVIVASNATPVNGITVEVYVPASGGMEKLYIWELVEAPTTAATTGVFTTTNGFNVGQRIMIHAVRSATKFTYDRWLETLVPGKAEGLPAAPIGSIAVWAYPLAAGHLSLAIYTKTGSPISTTETLGTFTSLSKAAQAASLEAYSQVSISDTWSAYGQDPWIQPSTSKKYEARELVTVMTIAFNVSGMSWKDSTWSSVQVSSGIKRAKIIKGTEYSPNVIATDNSANKRITPAWWVDLQALADNTGVKITVVLMDYQLWDTVKENGSVSTIGVNFGYTYLKSVDFYVKIIA